MKNKVPIISWLLLVLTTGIFVYIRLRLLTLPLERDEGEYAYAGQQILNGGLPYRDVYNMKFPGVYYFYSLFLALFGNTVTAIRLGTLIINLLTAFFILKTGEKIKSLTAGIFAACAFLALSAAPHFQGLMANTEHFVNLFIAIGAFFIFSWINSERKILLLFTGIMGGMACLMKQHGTYFLGVATVAIILQIPLQRKNLLVICRRVLVLLTGFSIPLISMLGYVLANGTFNKFVFLTIKYGRTYISHYTFSYGFWQFFFSFGNCINNNHVMWLILLTGLFFSNKLLPKKLFIVMLIWFILAIAAVFPGYYFREHYFLYMMPPSAIYFGLVFNYLLSLKNNKYRSLPQLLTLVLFLTAMLYFLIGERRIFFTDTPAIVTDAIYHDKQFSEAVTIADTVKNYLPPHQHILVIGSEPEIYFYTRRTSASSYIYMYPIMEDQPWHDSMANEFTHQSIYNNPAVVIVSRRAPIDNTILAAVFSSEPGLTLKGFCYKNGKHTEKFLWNKANDKNIPLDSIMWEIYVRKDN